jgi:hypothetical protein
MLVSSVDYEMVGTKDDFTSFLSLYFSRYYKLDAKTAATGIYLFGIYLDLLKNLCTFWNKSHMSSKLRVRAPTRVRVRAKMGGRGAAEGARKS